MGLAWRPHLGQIFRVSADKVGDRIIGYSRTLVGEFGGQLTRKNPRNFLNEFGLEAKNPSIWLMDLGVEIKAGDRVVVGVEEFRVLADGVVRDAEPKSSHLMVLLERI